MVASGIEVGFVYVQESYYRKLQIYILARILLAYFTIITSWYETKSSPICPSRKRTH